MAAVLLALPLAPRAWDYFQAEPQVDYAPITLTEIGRQALDAFAVGISPTLSHPVASSWPLAGLALLGLLAAWSRPRSRRGAWLALLSLGMPLLLLATLSAVRPIYNGPRHALVAWPGFLLLAGAGLGAVADALADAGRALRGHFGGRSATATNPPGLRASGGRFEATARLLGTLGVATALTVPAARVAVQQLARQFHGEDYVKDDLRSAAVDVAGLAAAGDAIVLHDPLIQFAFDYEYDRAGGRGPWQTIPRFDDDEGSAARRLRALGEEHSRVWLLERPKPRNGFDPNYLIEKADEGWTRQEERSYDRMWLSVRWAVYDTGLALEGATRPWHVEPTGGVPVGARMSEGIALHSVGRCIPQRSRPDRHGPRGAKRHRPLGHDARRRGQPVHRAALGSPLLTHRGLARLRPSHGRRQRPATLPG